MKRIAIYLVISMAALSIITTHPVLAQTETPPVGSTGKVTGKIINQNTGAMVKGVLDVMLHILQNDAGAGMLHGQSQADGSFFFSDVPFDANSQYAVMAIFNGVTYFSEVTPVDMASMQVTVEVPVYESTSDVSDVQVNQMHVLFNYAEDGLETKEIYILSNIGERTVKDVYKLDGDRSATFKFPLPPDADFIFFKPNDQNRFVKFDGGFADTYPILPGTQSAQIVVSYLTPFSEQRTYSYIAPLNILRMNFLVQEDANVSLQGTGLAGPERMTLEDGNSYLVYSFSNINAGQTIEVSFVEGDKSNSMEVSAVPLAASVGILGLMIMGYGIWWWRRPDESDEEVGEQPDTEMDFNQAINEIASLDEAYEKGEIEEQEYRESRDVLRKKAKALLGQDGKEN